MTSAFLMHWLKSAAGRAEIDGAAGADRLYDRLAALALADHAGQALSQQRRAVDVHAVGGRRPGRTDCLPRLCRRRADKIDDRAAHIKRLKDGECTIELGFVLNDILANFERISDHCSNIAVCKLELVEGMMDAHAYLHNLKNTNNEEFVKSYNEYREKYALKNTP